MNPLIQPKTATSPLLITLTLLCFGFFPKAQAVVPAPDGGYPGFNTAEGQNALFSVTTGLVNTAVGWNALFSNTDGTFNTAVGAGALLFNIGDQNTGEGTQNTAIGTAALLFNTTGSTNTAVGTGALLNNTGGFDNTAIGPSALHDNTTGIVNTAIGDSALFLNTSGSYNTAVGPGALSSNTTGGDNTAVGDRALHYVTGSGNIALGSSAGVNVTTANNVICIGVDGNNVNNACYIGQIFGATSSGGAAVLVNINGKLGTVTSSRRFKDEIKPMDKASEAVFALKPVTFRYKKEIDPAGASQFGLVAEEVEKVNADLIVRDKEGKPYSVRYDQVNAMLLNEFLKEHRKVQEQQATIAQLKKDFGITIAHLTTRLDEQAAQIRKVSAQLASKPAPQVVNNP